MTDAEAITRFEAFVHAQRPATTPWTPVTDYSLEARRVIEGRHPELIWQHLIGCDDADVLDYGCGPDAHLVTLLRAYQAAHQPHAQVRIVGYDPQIRQDRQSVDLTRAKPSLSRIWDLVICREVLEHCTVTEVVRVIRDLCALSAHLIYVTTRFHPSPDHLLEVADHDDLDPTHITLLTKPFLRTLFVLEGCKSRPDLEAKLDWQHQGRCLVCDVNA